jgi:inosine/xanthosine triphosphatase
MKILVASENPAKLKAVKNAFSKYFKNIEVVGKKVPSGVADTPLTEEETLEGVKNRIKGLDKVKGFDFKVAIEAGTNNSLGIRYLFTWVMIKQGSKESFGRSISYPLPHSIYKSLENGKPLSEMAERLSGEEDIRSKGGFVEFLSKGRITRSYLTEDAVICALFPFINENIYK